MTCVNVYHNSRSCAEASIPYAQWCDACKNDLSIETRVVHRDGVGPTDALMWMPGRPTGVFFSKRDGEWIAVFGLRRDGAGKVEMPLALPPCFEPSEAIVKVLEGLR